MNSKWSTSGSLTVANRHVQIPLLVDIPAEPVMPVGDPNAVPTTAEIARFAYYTSVYKGLKDVFDKATKIHKEANEAAEKAYNDYASVHAPNSRVITAHREIHQSRKADALRIVADLGRLGLTYEAAMVLIAANAAGNVALIAQLQPLCNLYPAIIARATNMAILWECQDYIEDNFAPGKSSQHGYFKKRLEDLRDRDVPEGMNEVSRLFTTNLTYLEMAGGALPEKIIEDMLDCVLTHSSWRDWVEQMHMETLRQTPRADRHHTWQQLLSDIKLRVDGDPTKDPFRHASGKRTATQAGYFERDEPYRRPRGTFSAPGTHDQIIDARVRMADRGGGRWQGKSRAPSTWTRDGARNLLPKHVAPYLTSSYGPGDGSRSSKGRCNRCGAIGHWVTDCRAEKCCKCGAPIKGGVYHDATICITAHPAGSRNRRDDFVGRAGRVGRMGRGGRGSREGRGTKGN